MTIRYSAAAVDFVEYMTSGEVTAQFATPGARSGYGAEKSLVGEIRFYCFGQGNHQNA